MAKSTETRVVGLEKVLNKLNSRLKELKGPNMKAGLIQGGLMIMRGSQQRVPVDTGNLKASAYVQWDGGSTPEPKFSEQSEKTKLTPEQLAMLKQTHEAALQKAQKMVKSQKNNDAAVVAGHSAYYALFVHEDLNAAHMVGQAKFLENTIKEDQKQIFNAVKIGMKGRKK